MINNPVTNITMPTVKLTAKGMMFNVNIKSINTPVNTMLPIVPSPIFSLQMVTMTTITTPATIEATPMLNPVVRASPTWKTSQGAYPILAFMEKTMPRAVKNVPTNRIRRRNEIF